jgi:hypothetical protein
LTLTETLLLVEVEVAIVFFVLLPIISDLKGKKVYVSRGYFDSIKTILILFIVQIAVLIVAINIQELFPSFSFTNGNIVYTIFAISISIAFFLSLFMVLRIGYNLLSKIACGEE